MIISFLAHEQPEVVTIEDWSLNLIENGALHLSDGFLETIAGMDIKQKGHIIEGKQYAQHDTSQPLVSPVNFQKNSIKKTLDKAEMNFEEIDAVFTSTNSPGYVSPSLSSILIAELRGIKRDVFHSSIVGMGCAGAVNLCKVLQLYLQANPDKVALGLVADFCSPYFPGINKYKNEKVCSFKEIKEQRMSLKEQEYELKKTSEVIQSYLFGDATATFIAAGDKWWENRNIKAPHLRLQKFKQMTNLDKGDEEVIGLFDGGSVNPYVENGRMYYTLTKRVPEMAMKYGSMIGKMYGGKKYDRYFFHTGSKKIIEIFQNSWDLIPEQLEESYGVLRDFGNVSQPSLPLMWDRYLNNGGSKDGAKVLTVGFGVGFMVAGMEGEVYC